MDFQVAPQAVAFYFWKPVDSDAFLLLKKHPQFVL